MTHDDSASTAHAPLVNKPDDGVEKAQEAARHLDRPGLVSTLRGFFGLIYATIFAFFGDNCSTMAAALSFNTFFSLPALLTLLLSLVGRVANAEEVQRAIVGQVGKLVGAGAATQVSAIISNAHRSPHAASVATIVSLVALVLGATASFSQLQAALNTAWRVKPDPHRNQLGVFLLKRVFSFGILITIAFLLLISLALSTVIAAIGQALTTQFGTPPILLQIATALGSFVIVAFLFAIMFRYVPDARISWHDVRAGAIGTALLFVAGRTVIGLYLGQSDPGSVYGAASSLALVLIWVYYTSMILLLGAEFTKLWAQRYGHGIQPIKGAVAYVEEERRVKTG